MNNMAKQFHRSLRVSCPGGPGTVLPFWLESFLSWSLAIACLGVAFYYWTIQLVWPESTASNTIKLPLMTYSRRELTEVSALERYQKLKHLLELGDNKKVISEWTDAELVQRIRSDHIARRLINLIMLKQNSKPTTRKDSHNDTKTTSLEKELVYRLQRLWPLLVKLPPPIQRTEYKFEISIIVPAFKEDVRALVTKLWTAGELAVNPSEIEVVVVDAGHCTNLEKHLTEDSSSSSLTRIFGKVQLVHFKNSGGRGPCLNAGAKQANGRILTFLHADTRLSGNWDQAIQDTFETRSSSSMHPQEYHQVANSCAFSFAIDTSSLGLNGGYYPPGIKAIEATANWRTHWFSLPYGDQCLSIPRTVYDYIGGFPEQCLMEDYELVRLLRQRAAELGEEVAILNLKAFCSPRRWQKLGVLHVTYTNSYCVGLYSSGGITPDRLYELYYGTKPQNSQQKSPWEHELDWLLTKK